MTTDIEIARTYSLRPIEDVAADIGLEATPSIATAGIWPRSTWRPSTRCDRGPTAS
jgi:hypothetical protein